LTAGIDRAKAGELYSNASVSDARQQIGLQVVNAYGEWLTYSAKVDVYEKNLNDYKALRQQISRRIEEGVAASNELTLVDGRLQGATVELVQTQAQRDIAVARLNQLTSLHIVHSQLSRERPDVEGLTADLQVLQERALEMAPNLRQAQATLQSADAALRERRADFLPELYMRLEYQQGNFSITGQPTQSRIFIGMTSRFGAGLSVFSEEQRAVAQAESAREDIQTQKRAILEQVAVERVLQDSFAARIAASSQGVAAATELAESYGRQYLAGRKTWVEVLNTQRELLQVQLQHIDIEIARWLTNWRLALTTRGASSLAG
jgi:adhesin transport system outer membrane protein